MLTKYLQIFKVSFAQEFAYRLNFVMWRVRNVVQIFLMFYLWSSVFANPQTVVFGYDKNQMLTYVFGVLILKAIVLSARAVDVSGEIARGDITNLLLKPISYFKYWFTRDLSSKVLNLSFAAVETFILFLILKPPIFIQNNPSVLAAFFLSLIIAVVMFFCFLFVVNLISFWMPENGWAAQFLFVVILVDFLSGGVFPLDILPAMIQKILYLLPFPYFLFFPLQIYLGEVTGTALMAGLLISLFWLGVLLVGLNLVWNRGIKKYEAVGR